MVFYLLFNPPFFNLIISVTLPTIFPETFLAESQRLSKFAPTCSFNTLSLNFLTLNELDIATVAALKNQLDKDPKSSVHHYTSLMIYILLQRLLRQHQANAKF